MNDEEILKIDKLQKELEEKTTILMAGADKVKQLEKENEKLKKNEIIAENRMAELSIRHGNDRDKIRYLQKENEELEKIIDLMATELSRRPLMIYLDDERDDRLVILDNPKEIIKYYTKKAEEDKEEK